MKRILLFTAGDLPQIIYLPSQGMLPTMDLHQ